jgi:hypothetical protein
VLAEPGAVEAVEGVAMFPLFLGHVAEDIGGCRKIRPKAVREALIDSGIFLLARNGEGDNLTLGEFRESFQGSLLIRRVLN